MAVNFFGKFIIPAEFKNKINKANLNPCPDQLVGNFDGTTFTPYQKRSDIDYVGQNQINNGLKEPIVIILESPHISEYDPVTSMALGPAMGKTGENLKKISCRKNSKI